MNFCTVIYKFNFPVIKPTTKSVDRLLYFALLKLFNIFTGVMSKKASFNPLGKPRLIYALKLIIFYNPPLSKLLYSLFNISKAIYLNKI